MASEGQFPKADGDILFGSEANLFLRNPQKLNLTDRGLTDGAYSSAKGIIDASGGTLWQDVGNDGSLTGFNVRYLSTSDTISFTGPFSGKIKSNLDSAFTYATYEILNFENDAGTATAGDWTGETSTNTGYVQLTGNGAEMYYSGKNYYQTTHTVYVLWSEFRSPAGSYGNSSSGLYITNGTNRVALVVNTGNGSGERKYLTVIKFNGTDNSVYNNLGSNGSVRGITEEDISSVTTNNYIGFYAGSGATSTFRCYAIVDDDISSASSSLATQFQTHLAAGGSYQTAENVTLGQNKDLTTAGKYGKLNLNYTAASNEILFVHDGGFTLR